MVQRLFLPFIAFTQHYCIHAPVKETPFLLKTSDVVGTKVVRAATFIFWLHSL